MRRLREALIGSGWDVKAERTLIGLGWDVKLREALIWLWVGSGG